MLETWVVSFAMTVMGALITIIPVSYTHLDVYKRQEQMDPLAAELFSAYAEAKDALSADDIEDVKLFMRMLARRRRRQKNGQGKAE